jgi:chromosome segregation ATPase
MPTLKPEPSNHDLLKAILTVSKDLADFKLDVRQEFQVMRKDLTQTFAKELTGVKGEIEGLREEFTDMKLSFGKMEGDLKDLQQEFKGIKKELVGVKTEVRSIKEELSEVHETIDFLKDNAVTHDEFQTTVKEVRNEIVNHVDHFVQLHKKQEVELVSVASRLSRHEALPKH